MSPSPTNEFFASTETPATVLLPDPRQLFARRSARFAALAHGHSLAAWLDYLALLSQAQQDAVPDLSTLTADPQFKQQACEHGMPPLNAVSYPRPSIWIDTTRRLAAALTTVSPESVRARIAALQSTPSTHLETLADRLLTGHPDPSALPETTMVAAALQTVWTALAATLDARTLKLLEPSGLCPCCGSLPVSSILKTSAQINNLRYLHCALCNTEWNVARATCTACATDQAVHYRQIDGSSGSVRAESCDHCQSYLKIMAQEKDPDVDPVADDLATLALDLLVDEAGYSRSGPNLLLLGGAA